MKESALDDCPGMSPRRKALLLEKFGSVARIRKATSKEIAKIQGISENFAIIILKHLS
jgi:excinuclease ABC subunit C